MSTARKGKPRPKFRTAAAGGNGSAQPSFDWPLANEAETLLRSHLQTFLKRNSFARQLCDRMAAETGTDRFEWLDHLVLPAAEEASLRQAGFAEDEHAETPNGETVFEHPRATLPRVLVRPGKRQGPSILALRPEFVADFIASHQLSNEPEGEPFSRYRRVVAASENGTQLEA